METFQTCFNQCSLSADSLTELLSIDSNQFEVLKVHEWTVNLSKTSVKLKCQSIELYWNYSIEEVEIFIFFELLALQAQIKRYSSQFLLSSSSNFSGDASLSSSGSSFCLVTSSTEESLSL